MAAPKAVWDEINESLDQDMKVWTKSIDDHVTQYEKDQAKKKVTKVGTGVMVAFMLPPRVAEAIVVPGGEKADDMHITVVYLGKELTEAQVETVVQVLEHLTTLQAPLAGTIGGIGMFPASESTENRQVLVQLADIPYLESFREKLIEGLAGLGISTMRNHGYCPHVTLEYAEQVQPPLLWETEYKVKVNGVTLCVGEDRTFFPFTSRLIAKAWGEF